MSTKAISELRAHLERLEEEVKNFPDYTLRPSDAEALRILRDGSVLGDHAALVAQGASWSASDEVLGTARSWFGDEPGKILAALQSLDPEQYKDLDAGDVGRALERAPVNRMWEEEPWTAFGLELAGGLVTRRPSLPNLPRSFAKSIKQGAIEGAVSGFNSSEGGLEERGFGAVTGGVLGGGAGGALELGGRGVRSFRSATNTGAPRKTQRIARSKAKELISDALEMDAKTPEEALDFIRSHPETPLVLADVGENLRGRLEAVHHLPGRGKSVSARYLSERLEGRPARLDSILSKAYGTEARYFDDYMALRDARADRGNELYEQAFRKNIPVDDDLKSLLKTDAAQRAVERASRMASNAKTGFDVRIRADGTPTVNGQSVADVNTEFFHWLKMAMDDVAFPKSPAEGIGAGEIKLVRDLRTDLIDYIDRHNPDYQAARSAWAGETAVMHFMERGRKLLSEDADELAYDLSKASDGELEAFRLGALAALRDKAENSIGTANVARDMIKRPRHKKLLRLTFEPGESGDAAFDDFMHNLGGEIEAAITESTMGNSRTAARVSGMDEIRRAGQSQVPPVGRGPLEMLMDSISRDMGDVEAQTVEAIGTEMATMLTERGRLEDVLAELSRGTSFVEALRRTATTDLLTPGMAGRLAASSTMKGLGVQPSEEPSIADRLLGR